MAQESADRFVFVVEYFDQASTLTKTYNLIYFTQDDTVEMYDIKNKKTFLKRTKCENLTLRDIYVGAILNIFSRQLKIVNYADVHTKKHFEQLVDRTFAMIKPDSYSNIGKIIDLIEKDGFKIQKLKMTQFNRETAEQFYGEHKGKPFFETLVNFMISDFIVGMELVAQDAIAKWRALIGPTNSNVARQQAPNSIRALYGTDGTRNACHGSDSVQSAERELNIFFGSSSKLKTTALLNNCTCCVIKPHVLQNRNAGQIIDRILTEGFEISAMEIFYLDKPSSEEFLEIYKGVLPEFNQMAEHLTLGACIALEVRQENAVNSFRQLCGPYDPETSRVIRKQSIRAQFGQDIARNAVHCTDIEEDGVLESEYFFSLLQNQQK